MASGARLSDDDVYNWGLMLDVDNAEPSIQPDALGTELPQDVSDGALCSGRDVTARNESNASRAAPLTTSARTIPSRA